eukprot:1156393-Pelagomonas_calceolata.AAC.12
MRRGCAPPAPALHLHPQLLLTSPKHGSISPTCRVSRNFPVGKWRRYAYRMWWGSSAKSKELSRLEI